MKALTGATSKLCGPPAEESGVPANGQVLLFDKLLDDSTAEDLMDEAETFPKAVSSASVWNKQMYAEGDMLFAGCFNKWSRAQISDLFIWVRPHLKPSPHLIQS